MRYVAIISAWAATVLVGGWSVMLLVGALHGWWHVIPTMGYWTATLVFALIRGLAAATPPTKSARDE